MLTKFKNSMKGFKKVFPDENDKDYFYWEKKIKHPLLKGLHIIVNNETIAVWCNEANNKINGVSLTGSSSNIDVALHFCKYSDKKLEKILQWLSLRPFFHNK